MDRVAGKAKRFWHGLSSATRVLIFTIIALLVIGRLVMPYAVKHYVNKKLQQLPGYGGSIGDVDIHLYRGAYSIHDVDIVKKTNNVPIPFVRAERVDFSVQWRELRNHALVAEVELDRAELNFVKGETKEEDQTKIDESWVTVVQDLFPFKIDRFEIRDSVVRYADLSARPQVDIAVTNLHILCHNITNSRNVTNELPTPFQVTGTTIGGGRLDVRGAANPFTKSPRFDVNAKLEGTELTALNDFLQAYAKVDVKRGTLNFYAEMAAADGKFKGYAKPLVQDLDIVDLTDNLKKPLKLFWESFVAGVMKLFKNQPKDRLAAKVPIEGDMDNPKASIVETLASVLRNAFVRALSPGVDESINLETVKPDPRSRPVPQRDTTKNEKSEQEKVRAKQEEKK
ncbi:MAG TPA: DUF748 domain-containing protein [Methylomirabilota bacterium]|nr:DUF748 domain-containing protein [Methylomirabilota bacterium]